MVRPVSPTLSSASFTSSSLNGLMIASIFFTSVTLCPPKATEVPRHGRCAARVFAPLAESMAVFPALAAHECGSRPAGDAHPCASAGGQPDRQMAQPRVLVAARPLRPPVELDAREAGQQGLVEDPQLESRQFRPEAEVHPMAEPEVRIRIAVDPEPHRIRKDELVAVRGGFPEDDLVAWRDRLPAERRGPRRRTPVVGGRARPAHHLLDG